MTLAGQCALVTGGGVRLGRALALALAVEGMRLIVHYHASAAAAEQVVREIGESGGEAVALRADLADGEAAVRLAGEAEAAFGGVDVLVNSAAVFPSEPIEATDTELWDHTLAVNLRAPFLLTREIAPAMRSRGAGCIVNLLDLSALQSWRGYAAHSVAKAGLAQLTRVAAREFAPEVRVVAIAPGSVLPPDELSDEQVRRLAERAPLGRIGSPDDVVAALLYLLRAPFITGETLTVDGGRTLS
ncbi:MAG: SDR family oxidoreductase [Longimicrobiaceae bacterium]